MNILFVASGNKNDKPGAVVLNQALSIQNEGVSVDFFLIKRTGLIGYLRNITPLSRYIRLTKPQIIHAHYSLSAIVASFAALLSKRKPLVVSFMGSDAHLKGFYRIVVKVFYRTLWSKAIVKSEEMRDKLSLNNAIVIPNGVDLKSINSIGKEIDKYSNPDSKRILFAADPARESKNWQLATAASEILGVDINVVYNVPHEKIIQEILASQIVLLTSKWEGSPNVVKEAMACNCPIVATDVGDVRWLFADEPGHFITSFEPEDVAEKIKLALQFSKEKGRTNGRQRIIELGLDSETIAKQIIEIYKSVVKDEQ